MKKNNILEKRRKSIPEEVKELMSLSFSIVDRIHEILQEQGKSQKDLANLLNKDQSEISRWMRGNHNFTIETLAKIQNVLGEAIFEIYTKDKITHQIYMSTSPMKRKGDYQVIINQEMLDMIPVPKNRCPQKVMYSLDMTLN